MNELIIPVLGIMTGLIVPLGVFVWLYFDARNKRETIIEISKNIQDPSQLQMIVESLEGKKRSAEDNKRGGMITLFVGIGIFLLGMVALGPVVKGAGLLVAAVGAGVLLAGYLFPVKEEARKR